MPTYGDAIKEHAKIAVQLYKPRLPELEAKSGLKFFPDGTCTGTTAQDVERYLQAIKAIGGPVSYTSAKLVLMNAIAKLGLPAVAL
jgi:hypothetical protein